MAISNCSIPYALNIFASFHLQSVMEFLKDLPSYDEHNFTLYNSDHGIRTCSKRPSIYLPTKDIPSEQSKYAIIITFHALSKNFTCEMFNYLSIL